MQCDISEATIEYAADICRIRKKSWLATYPNKGHGIKSEDILSNYDFTSASAIASTKRAITDKDHEEKFWIASIPLITKKSKKIIGFAACQPKDNVMTMLYVEPHFTRHGVGSALWKIVFKNLDQTRPIEVVVVSYNQSAIQFYRRRGFVFDGDVMPPEAPPASLFPSQKLHLLPKNIK